MTVVCSVIPNGNNSLAEELLQNLETDLNRLVRVTNVRKSRGKRVAKKKGISLFSTPGKRVAPKTKSTTTDYIKKFDSQVLPIIKDKTCSLGNLLIDVKDKALTEIDKETTSFIENDYAMFKNYLSYKAASMSKELYKLRMQLDKKIAVFNNVLSNAIGGKRAKKSKIAYLPLSCAALTLVMLLTGGTYLKNSTKNVAKDVDFQANTSSFTNQSEKKLETIVTKVAYTYNEAKELTKKEAEEKAKTQDGIEILDVEEELNDNNINSLASLDASKNLELSDNSSKSGLVYFNPNEFYRCPADVTTEELLAIFGITPDQFYNEMFGTFYGESYVTKNGYNEVYNTFYVLINRICFSNWFKYGINLYTQMQAPSQFSVWLKHDYKSFSEYPEETRTIALQAMRDAMYNFIVDPTHAPHEWSNFRSNGSVSYSNNLFTPGGNRYSTENHNYTVIYPDFLQSEAAIALRNKALGITNESEKIETALVYDYENNEVIIPDAYLANVSDNETEKIETAVVYDSGNKEVTMPNAYLVNDSYDAFYLDFITPEAYLDNVYDSALYPDLNMSRTRTLNY